jgi:hypothetical protein
MENRRRKFQTSAELVYDLRKSEIHSPFLQDAALASPSFDGVDPNMSEGLGMMGLRLPRES